MNHNIELLFTYLHGTIVYEKQQRVVGNGCNNKEEMKKINRKRHEKNWEFDNVYCIVECKSFEIKFNQMN